MTATRGRREFVEAGVAAGGCLLLCPFGAGRAAAEAVPRAGAYVFDETMGYCCAECTPEKCKWLGDDEVWKAEKARETSERLGRIVRPDEITCSRCRIPEEHAFDAIRKCPIRKCAQERKLLSCAHCSELSECERANPKTRERALAIRDAVLGDS